MRHPEPPWKRRFSPQRYWSQVPPEAVQASLRTTFQHWGLPRRIRVDNGTPWGSWNDLPPALALWWIGLGIEVIWDHPHRPQENGVVERFNGVLQDWGEPQQCADLAAWRKRVQWVVHTQREVYPAISGQPRRHAFPDLARPWRPFDPASERQAWHLKRVLDFLAHGRWPRRVSKVGQITVYGRVYSVGRPYARQRVWLRLQPQTCDWLIEDDHSTLLSRYPATQLTADRILDLDVAHSNRAGLTNSATT